MRLKPEQIKKLSRSIYDKLIDEDLIVLRGPESAVIKKIENILLADARAEDDIEVHAKEMMKKFMPQVQSGEIDYQKMYGMIKKQLIRDKKFVV